MIHPTTKRVESGPPEESAKALGAFYTDVEVADFLVWWAVRAANDSVMDPSFGGGVFLRSACRRLAMLGGQPPNQISGAEVDPQVYNRVAMELSEEHGIAKGRLWLSDFFELEPLPVRLVDAIVGNPPFIRYQRFSGEVRNRAIHRAADQGVRLTELASSWAAFVIHSTAFLKMGGRLGMVLPMEIAHASYALPVLRHLDESFGKITLVTFQNRLFPDLSEDTVLLLAENKGASPSSFLTRDLAHSETLSDIRIKDQLPLPKTKPMNGRLITQGKERLVRYLISEKARELYDELSSLPQAKRLGEVADVGIGYVTGANDFFHLSPRQVGEWGIPQQFLKTAVRRGRALTGLEFTCRDWEKACETGDAGYLLFIAQDHSLPESVLRYLEHGKSKGVPQAYKCRVRTPWFSVPHVRQSDAFLTYMSGELPRLVTNRAEAVAPNSLHTLVFRPNSALSGELLAASWMTSLTRLSAEIEGHALGGGMLKLEPTEAEKVIVANSRSPNGDWISLSRELDALARRTDMDACTRLADDLILHKHLGLSSSDIGILASAAKTLRNRRYGRTRAK
jgi:adenine-specific DNA-methyltransferase